MVLERNIISNNSQLNLRNIGLSPNSSLQCIIDRNSCCFSQDPRVGEWYLPSGELVQGTVSTTEFYRNRGDDGSVFLNRPSEITSPTGQFCCKITDTNNMNQTLCVIIGELNILWSQYNNNTVYAMYYF